MDSNKKYSLTSNKKLCNDEKKTCAIIRKTAPMP